MGGYPPQAAPGPAPVSPPLATMPAVAPLQPLRAVYTEPLQRGMPDAAPSYSYPQAPVPPQVLSHSPAHSLSPPAMMSPGSPAGTGSPLLNSPPQNVPASSIQQKAHEFVYGSARPRLSPTRGLNHKSNYGVNGSPSLLERLQRHRENVPTEQVGREAEIRMLETQLQEEQARSMAEQAYASRMEQATGQRLHLGPYPQVSARVQALQERLRGIQGTEQPELDAPAAQTSACGSLLEWGERLKQERATQ